MTEREKWCSNVQKMMVALPNISLNFLSHDIRKSISKSIHFPSKSARNNSSLLYSFLAGFGAGTPQQEAVPKGQEFSRIENLWPRDDSCSHVFGKRSFYGYRNQTNVPTAVEMLDQLSAICKRFGVDYYAASQNQRDLLDSIALHEYQLKKAREQGLKRSEVPPFLGLKRSDRSNDMPA